MITSETIAILRPADFFEYCLLLMAICHLYIKVVYIILG